MHVGKIQAGEAGEVGIEGKNSMPACGGESGEIGIRPKTMRQ